MNKHPIHRGYQRSELSWKDATPQARLNWKKEYHLALKANGEPFLSRHGRFYYLPKKIVQKGAERFVGVATAEPRPIRPRRKFNRFCRPVARAIAIGLLAWFLMICVLGYYETVKASPKGYYWPIVPPNEIAYASGPRDLPQLGNDIVKGQEAGATFRGKASYYSADGCLGCHPDQIMANGEKFDENAHTLAVPAEWVKEGKIELNTVVSVTNLDNGKQVFGALITDTGGFGKYDRIADLSKALYEELGVQTDVSVIEIKVLPTLDQVFSSN